MKFAITHQIIESGVALAMDPVYEGVFYLPDGTYSTAWSLAKLGLTVAPGGKGPAIKVSDDTRQSALEAFSAFHHTSFQGGRTPGNTGNTP